MAITRRFQKPVVPHEELDATVAELLAFARAEGLKMRAEAGRDGMSSRVPDVSGLIHDELRSLLEDEIVTTTIESSDGSIDQTELDHELTKKALVGLKASQLKEAAKSFGVAARGSSEDLAEAIARHYQWNENEIAAFILRNLDEPNEATSHLTRVFAFSRSGAEAAQIREACLAVVGRYIRTDIAKWFVFHSVEAVGASTIYIEGSYMAYTVNVDEMGDTPSLSPTPSAKRVSIAFSVGDTSYVRVNNAPIQASRTAAKAVAAISGSALLGYVPRTQSEKIEALGGLHDASTFFLDLIYNRIPAIGVDRINLTLIRFQMERDSKADSDNRPALKAVRFEGSHLLDSVAACRILAKERRPIANVAMRLSYKGDAEFSEIFPLALSLESDHFAVTTGIGVGGTTNSVALHQAAVQSVVDEVAFGSADQTKLDQLAAKVLLRADQDKDPENADILD